MRIDAPASESSVGLRVGLDSAAAALLATARDLAYEFAEYGSAGIEDELVRFVQAARRHGADALLGTIVLDRRESDVARQRAFGAMHRQVARQIGQAEGVPA
jgi:DNA-binding NarL/FixJ family response regulator